MAECLLCQKEVLAGQIMAGIHLDMEKVLYGHYSCVTNKIGVFQVPMIYGDYQLPVATIQ